MSDWNLGTKCLRIEQDGPFAWCIIDRPHARNALTPAMYLGVKRAIRHVNQSKDARCLIITGTNDVFSPGGDLGGRSEPGDEPTPQGLTHELLPFIAIRESTAPVIAAVNGICQGGGLLMAMMADVAVVSDRATFRVPELLRGLIDASYAAMLPAHVGVAVARDLLLTARKIDAAEALRIGLISRVVPHDTLRAEARTAAAEVLRTAPEARAHTKRMLNACYQPIDYQTMFWALQNSQEPREGMKSFMEKRQPNWVPPDLPD
jgi:enoyl-CoA hydratase